MLNPILEQATRMQNGQPQQPSLQIQPIKQLMHQMQNMSNPNNAVQALLAQNPNLQALLRMSKGDLQSLAQEMAKQRHINLDSLIKELQS